MDSGKRHIEIRIRFAGRYEAAELEIFAPSREPVALRVWHALDRLRVRPRCPFLVHAGERLIVRAKLTDFDGSSLTEQRAAQVLAQLKSALDLRPAVKGARQPRAEMATVGSRTETRSAM